MSLMGKGTHLPAEEASHHTIFQAENVSVFDGNTPGVARRFRDFRENMSSKKVAGLSSDFHFSAVMLEAQQTNAPPVQRAATENRHATHTTEGPPLGVKARPLPR